MTTRSPQAHEMAELSSADVRAAIQSASEIPNQRFVGSEAPSTDSFEQLANYDGDDSVSHAKPVGGLWTAPATDRGNTYSDFVGESLIPDGTCVWDIEFAPETTVLSVDSKTVLHALPRRKPEEMGISFIDFEQVFDTYNIDGIYVTEEIAFSYSREYFPISLYYWDVASAVWDSLECIENIRFCGRHRDLVSYVNNN